MKLKKHLSLIILYGVLLLLAGCVGPGTSISTMQGLGKIMLPRFIAHGANPVDVSTAIHQIDSKPTTDNWTTPWIDLAKEYEYQGQKNLENNNIEDAKYQLLKSSVYYRIAAYPYPIDEKRNLAFNKSVNLFQQAIKFVNKPPKIITLTSDTKKIVGYYRLPGPNQKVPLVILLPGIDSSKEEMFWIEDQFLDKGYATFSIDIPGGAGSDWKINPEAEKLFLKVFNYLREDSNILPEKIAIVGFNFGGYWGLKLATRQDLNIKAVAAVDAPVHYAFEQSRLNQMPRFLAKIFLSACGVTEYNSMFKTLSSMSLKNADLLRDIKTPLLVIGSENNILVPPEDVMIFSRELKRPVALKLYKDGNFGVINNLQNEVYPMIANWLEYTFEK
jgi:2,6-dihydroxypseudooxynicotine hydrolase